ncbi:ATP dependant DNA helicase [Chondrus crispus]|uniref:ATP-dependent DNA helicase n=1 Tax=Chondrus crispus TaxID=2769 RepID=R7QT46_CHOCR|nr:ATP dependant DNA helicase [Chondrus crispus]CDF40520.1 ATP dependant DNA helicase [Chondrus crispus]|eukprot:XP_005710814.1 ATP dependant DNA helicase [Chondrus crispus]
MTQAQNLETSAERQTRLANARRSRRVSRRLFDNSTGECIDFGSLDVQCQFCGAFHFLEERLKSSFDRRPTFPTCCGNGKVSFPTAQSPPPFLRALLTGTEPRDRKFRNSLHVYDNVLSMASVVAKWVARGPGASNFNPTMTMQGRIYHYMGPLLPSTCRDPAFLSVYIHDTDYAEQSQIRAGRVRELDEGILTQLTAMLHHVNPYVQTFQSLREWASNDNSPTPYRMLNSNGNEVLDTISVTHRSYDPLSYVLLFPYGQDGRHPELRLPPSAASASSSTAPRRRNKVTPLTFYTWRLFQRPSEFSTILHARRLFQQYLVDHYCKIEAERLSYLRHNQQALRPSDYTSLRESLGDSGSGEDEADAVRAGRLFILPSTQIEGDRYMRQQMHDIIAISSKVGHPDIFLTVTCNPNWPQTVSPRRARHQTPQDRPDLCGRVFRLKLNALMSHVIDEKLFGTVVANVRVIEFQKRGLPHAHVIFFLDERSKNDLRTPANVDSIISAEIPPSCEAELQELVLKHMIHTLAGGVSVQMQMRIGSSHRMVTVDNSWVVPHSPKLLRTLACHINVKLCVSRVGGIKYLFKYVCKGSDRVTMEIIAENERNDEISNFQDARYVSASEATGTKLAEWFKANENYPGARHIKYDDFPRYFTWNSPREGEKYFLRLLLKQSFRSSFVPLSRVFATILAYCEPSDPRALWNEHMSLFLTDIRARARGPGNSSRRQQLSNDEHALSYPMEDLPPSHERPSTHSGHVNTEVLEQRLQQALPLFNEGQRNAFNRIVDSILPDVSAAPNSRVFFLDAPGGTGKTFLTNSIQNVLTIRAKTVLPVATSAVAAVLLYGGRTAHSVFKIPVPLLSDNTCNISPNSTLGEDMKDVDLIIWDEIVMCHRYCIEAVDRTLRDLTGTHFPFGGKHVLFSGDFRQILRVVPGGSRAQIVNACIRSLNLFRGFESLSLTENMRLSALHQDTSAGHEALQFAPHPSKNSALPEINEIVGDMILGAYCTFLSADKVENEDRNALRYPVELLNTPTAGSSLPDHQLKLKKGFVVMLLRNLNPNDGHVNGARHLVDGMSNSLLCLRVATGSHLGKPLCLPRMPCGPGDDNFPVPGFTRTQVPIRASFAMTTNKAQGQSFGGLLRLDLRNHCFSHGQLYAALSRTTHPGNVVVLIPDADKTTRNVVYPEVIS